MLRDSSLPLSLHQQTGTIPWSFSAHLLAGRVRVAQVRGRVDLGVGRAKNVAVAPHRAGTGGAARRRRRSIPTRTFHRQRQCMRERHQDRNRKTAKEATGDERAGNSVPRPIGGSDLEFFRSSARPEPAAYWPSGKRLISDVSANDCHWSFWVVKRANCVPHRREKGHPSERGCRFRQSMQCAHQTKLGTRRTRALAPVQERRNDHMFCRNPG